jgi:hypothetical protein
MEVRCAESAVCGDEKLIQNSKDDKYLYEKRAV